MRCTEVVWVPEESAHWGEGGDNGSHLTPADVSSSGHPIVCHKERKKRKLGYPSCKCLQTPNLFCLPPRHKGSMTRNSCGADGARLTNSCVCSFVLGSRAPAFCVPKWSHATASHWHHWDAMWLTSTDVGYAFPTFFTHRSGEEEDPSNLFQPGSHEEANPYRKQFEWLFSQCF